MKSLKKIVVEAKDDIFIEPDWSKYKKKYSDIGKLSDKDLQDIMDKNGWEDVKIYGSSRTGGEPKVGPNDTAYGEVGYNVIVKDRRDDSYYEVIYMSVQKKKKAFPGTGKEKNFDFNVSGFRFPLISGLSLTDAKKVIKKAKWDDYFNASEFKI